MFESIPRSLLLLLAWILVLGRREEEGGGRTEKQEIMEIRGILWLGAENSVFYNKALMKSGGREMKRKEGRKENGRGNELIGIA